MAAFLPIFKAALPYLAQIVTTTVPMFTSRTRGRAEEIVPKQIEELQTAVTHNAEAVRVLAQQMQETGKGLDEEFLRLRQDLQSARRIAWIAGAISIGCLVLTLVGALR
jgi:hypothetical protein